MRYIGFVTAIATNYPLFFGPLGSPQIVLASVLNLTLPMVYQITNYNDASRITFVY